MWPLIYSRWAADLSVSPSGFVAGHIDLMVKGIWWRIVNVDDFIALNKKMQRFQLGPFYKVELRFAWRWGTWRKCILKG